MAVEEAATSLTLWQWLKQAFRLPIGELLGRLSRLANSFPRNIVRVSRIKRMASARGMRPHIILLADRLGDIIAAEPTLRAIRQSDEFVVWMVRPRFAGLLEFNPNVDAVVEVSSYTEAVILCRWFSKVRQTNLHIDGILCNIFGFKIRNRNALGINTSNYLSLGCLSDVYSLIATGRRASSMPKIFSNPEFDPGAFMTSAFAEPQRPMLTLHAHSDEAAKSWADDKTQAFAEWVLKETDFNILEVGLTPVLAEGHRICLLRDRLPLSSQMAVVSRSDLFVGVDSGFAHIANAASVRSILLIGVLRGFTTHLPVPATELDVVLRSTSQASEIDVDEVVAAVCDIAPVPLASR